VTIADKLSNKVIEKILKQTNIPILSEEKKDNFDRLNSKYLWVIDPLD
jgi:3'(2'), 5'-bisphosphate nucleotidase